MRYQNTDAQIIGITLSSPFLRPINFRISLSWFFVFVCLLIIFILLLYFFIYIVVVFDSDIWYDLEKEYINDLLAWTVTEQPVGNNTNYTGIEGEISEQGTDEKVELLPRKIRTKESYKNVSSAEITKLLSPTAGKKNTRKINERNVQVVQVQAEWERTVSAVV